eukprot:symbB.v1.2.029230.t1/scaffold3079.1/size64120/3
MASIKVLEVIQLVMAAVQTAAGDSSPYVRKTAAQCMIKVYGVDADQFLELRKLLLKLMNDVEVQVVGSAVMAFRQICIVLPKEAVEDTKQGESSDVSWNARQLELLHPLFKRLVQDMLLMDSWGQQCCIDLLMRYCRLFFASPEKEKGDEAIMEQSYRGLRTLQTKTLPFLGSWSYAFPFFFFVIFVAVELWILNSTGYWESVKKDLVISGAGLVTIIAILAAFFISLFNRLEGLFHQLSLIQMVEREDPEDIEQNHQELMDKLRSQANAIKRLSHYYPLVFLVMFVVAEIIILHHYGYLDEVEAQIAKYAFYGITLLVFIVTCFVTAFLRIEGLFSDILHLVQVNLQGVEDLVNNVTANTQARLKSCSTQPCC